MSSSACSNPPCGKHVDTKKLLKCSRCLSVKYCSPDCQKADWRSGHKFKCPQLAEACIQDLVKTQWDALESFASWIDQAQENLYYSQIGPPPTPNPNALGILATLASHVPPNKSSWDFFEVNVRPILIVLNAVDQARRLDSTASKLAKEAALRNVQRLMTGERNHIPQHGSHCL